MNMNKTKWIFAAALLLVTACASDDATQTGEQKKETATNGYATFVAGKEPTQTRTSLDYNTGKFYWEAGDNIFVKDDAGTWQTASNAVSGTAKSYYRFLLSGAFAGTSYTVFYPGKNGTNDQVTIATSQKQTTPADTKHLGEAGDCGLATATGTSANFNFTLDHKAAILVFQPYTSDALLQDCYLRKIEVISDNNIAGTYTLDPVTKKLTGTGTSNTITLTTGNYGGGSGGFPMTNSSADLSTNGAYMVIAPGHHKLRVKYWLQSRSADDKMGNKIEGTVTKDLPTFNYEENNYYDMTANLQITYYPAANAHYMWDAQQEYWFGHRDAAGLPDGNFPPNNGSPADVRSYNLMPGYSDDSGSAPAVTATHTAAKCPNINEMAWYILRGEPHWDTDLWAMLGRLYAGGMWFKKKAQISGFVSNAAPDGTDYTKSTNGYNGPDRATPVHGKPSDSEISKYFYLPAFGYYDSQYPFNAYPSGVYAGYYWSSTPYSKYWFKSYNMVFSSYEIRMYAYERYYKGLSLWTAE
ncbi:hypothetical protein AS203_02675 [Hoylesella enoeca]|uniref:Fimbrillin family protein n=2 Tax=Hoylesella enoeca TaxID=76123 RepID=A0A0S2KJD3_9BACT|nr:hypothetical protein AS203_02675 [Hoylesella enoeca]